jgi:hypothetical protein
MSIYWKEVWVGPGAGLDAVKKKKYLHCTQLCYVQETGITCSINFVTAQN